MLILFVFAVCLCASAIGGICDIDGDVVIKPPHLSDVFSFYAPSGS